MTEDFIDAILIDSALFQKAKDAFEARSPQEMNRAEFDALVECLQQQRHTEASGDLANASTSSKPPSTTSPRECRRGKDLLVRPSPEAAMLFGKVDRFNHGVITWEDVVWFLTSEARSRVDSTRVEEDMRPYSFSRMRKGEPIKDKKYIPQNAVDPMSYVAEYQRRFKTDSRKKKESEAKLRVPAYRYQRKDLSFIKYIDSLACDRDVLAVVTRGSPLSFYRKSTLELVKTMTERELDGARPDFVSYLPKPDVCVTYTSDSRTIQCWMHLLSTVTATVNLSPYVVPEGAIRCLKTHATGFPNSFFAGDSYGRILQFEVPSKALDGVKIRLVRTFRDVHSREHGGISDMALSERAIFTTGFDHVIKKTDVRSGAMCTIGQTSEALVYLRYCASLECVVAVAALSHVVCVWDTTVDTLTEGKVLHRGHFYHHACKVIGLSCVEDLFQAVSCDTAGEVRVWDLRTLRCVQSLRADGLVKNDNTPENMYILSKKNLEDEGSAVVQGGKPGEKLPFVCSTYFDATHEIVTCTKDAIYCLQHNFLTHPRMCDLDVVQETFYNYRGKTFLLLGSTRLSMWDSQEGYRKVILDRALDVEVPLEEKDVCACCLDAQSSRLFLAFSDGNVDTYAADNLEERISQLALLTDDYVVEMEYSSRLQLLICVTNGGALLFVCEDPENPFSFYQHMASSHLTSLTVSEQLGRVAFADDEHHVFYYEMKIKNQRQINYCEVTMSQQPRRLLFLGTSPVLMSVHGEGTFVFWRCSTSYEVGLEQLLIFDAFHETTLRHFIHFTNRLCGAGFERGVELDSKPVSKSGRSTAGSRRSTTSRAPSLASTMRGRPHTSERLAGANDSSTNELLQTIRSSDNKILKKNLQEITSVAFDDRTHRLFAGDSKGFLYTYNTCALFQAFGVERVDHDTGTTGAPQQDALPPSAHRAARPLLINTAQPHGDSAIVSLRWVPETGTLLSSGEDRAVALLSERGEVADYLVLTRLPTTEASHSEDGLTPFRPPTRKVDHNKEAQTEGEGGTRYCTHVNAATEALQQAMVAAPKEVNEHDAHEDTLHQEDSGQSTFTLTNRIKRVQSGKWPRRHDTNTLSAAHHAAAKQEEEEDANENTSYAFSYTAYLEECRQQQQPQRSVHLSAMRSVSSRPAAMEPLPAGNEAHSSASKEGAGAHTTHDEGNAPSYDCLQFSANSFSQEGNTTAAEHDIVLTVKWDDEECLNASNGNLLPYNASRTKEPGEDQGEASTSNPVSRGKPETEIVNLGRIKDTTSRPFQMPLKALYASEVQAPYYPWMQERKKEETTFSLRDVVAANFEANKAPSTKVRGRPCTAQTGQETNTSAHDKNHKLKDLMVVSAAGKPRAGTVRNNNKDFSARTGVLPPPTVQQRPHARSTSTPRTTGGVYKGLTCHRTVTTSPPPLSKRTAGSQRDALFDCQSLSRMVSEYDKELRRCLQGSHGKKKDTVL